MKVEKQSTTAVEVPLKPSVQSLDVSFSPDAQRFRDIREEFLSQRPSSTVTQLHQLDSRLEEVRDLTRAGSPGFSAAFKGTAASFAQLTKPEQNSYREEIDSLSSAVVDYSRRAMRNGTVDATDIKEIAAGLRSLGLESKSFNAAVEEYARRSIQTGSTHLGKGDIEGASRALSEAAALILDPKKGAPFPSSGTVTKELQEKVKEFIDVCHKNSLEGTPQFLAVNAISERLGSLNRAAKVA